MAALAGVSGSKKVHRTIHGYNDNDTSAGILENVKHSNHSSYKPEVGYTIVP